MHVRTQSVAVAPASSRPWTRLPRGAGYLLVLALFLVFAAVASTLRPRPVSGLAGDADVREAQALVHGRIASGSTDLRVRSSLLGGEAGGSGVIATAVPDADLARAAALLQRARARRPLEPRIAAACATLDLARGRLDDAERRLRAALASGSPYPEARLLLGVTLAERSRRARVPQETRALVLQAIAQFAAVPVEAPEYPAALYNRTLLLDRVGRADEARDYAREYFALDPGGPWAGRLARALAARG